MTDILALADDLAEAGHPHPRRAAAEAYLRNEAHRLGLVTSAELWPRPRPDGTVPDPLPMSEVRHRIRRHVTRRP